MLVLECAKGCTYGLDETTRCGLTFEPLLNGALGFTWAQLKAAGADVKIVKDNGNTSEMLEQVFNMSTPSIILLILILYTKQKLNGRDVYVFMTEEAKPICPGISKRMLCLFISFF